MADDGGGGGGDKKDGGGSLTREQLLQYVKKAKQQMKKLQADLAEAQKANQLLQEGQQQPTSGDSGEVDALKQEVQVLKAALEEARRGEVELRDRCERAEAEQVRLEELRRSMEAQLATYEHKTRTLSSAGSDSMSDVGSSGRRTPEHHDSPEGLKAENTALLAKLKQLVEKYKTLQTKAKSINEEKLSLEAEVKRLQEGRVTPSDQVSSLERELEALKGQVQAMEEESIQYKTRADAASEQARLKEKEVGELMEQMKTLAAEKGSIEEEVEGLKEQAQEQARAFEEEKVSLREEVERLKAGARTAEEMEALEKLVEEQKEQVEALMEEKASLESELGQVKEQAIDQEASFRKEMEELRSQAQALEEEKRSWQDEMDKLKAHSEGSSDASAQTAQLESQLESMKEEVERLKEQAQERAQAFEEEKASLMEEVQRLKAGARTAEEMGAVEKLVEEQKERVEALMEEKASLESQVQALEEEKRSWQDEMDRLKAESKGAADALAQSAQLENQLEGLKGQLEAMAEEKAAMEEEVERLKVAADQLREPSPTPVPNMADLERQLEDMRGTLKATQEEKMGLEDQVVQLQEAVAAAAVMPTPSDDAIEETKRLSGVIDELRASLEEKEKEIHQTLQQLQQREGELSSAQEELKEAMTALERSQEEVEEGKVRLTQVTQELGAKLEEAQAAPPPFPDRSADVERLEGQYAELEKKYEALKTQLDAREAAMIRLQEERAAMAEQAETDQGRLEEEIKGVKQQLTSKTRRVKELEAQCQALTDQLQSLEDAIKKGKEEKGVEVGSRQLLEVKLKEAEEGRARAVGEKNDLDEQIASLIETLNQTRKQLAAAKEEKVKALAKVTTLQEEREQLMEKLDQTQTSKAELRTQLSDAAAASEARLNEELKAVKEELAAAKNRLADASSGALHEGEKLRDEASGLKDELVRVKAELTDASEEMARVRTELEAARKQATTAEGRCKDLEDSVKRLKMLVKQLRAAVQQREQDLNKNRLSQSSPEAPPAFSIRLRVRDEGVVWCRIVTSPPASAEEKSVSALPPPAWVTEEVVQQWMALENGQGAGEKESEAGKQASCVCTEAWPDILQDQVAMAARQQGEKEKEWFESLRAKEEELSRIKTDFDRYRARAHSALKKATEKSGEERQRDRSLEEDNIRLREEMKRTTAKFTEYEREVEGLKVSLTAMEKDRTELETTMVELRGRMSELEGEVKKAQEETAAKASEIERLKQDLVEGDRECDALEEKVCELQTQVEKMKVVVRQTREAKTPPRPPPEPQTPESTCGPTGPDVGPITPAGQAAGEDAAHGVSNDRSRLSISLDHLSQSGHRVLNSELGIKLAPLAIPSVPSSSRSAPSDDGVMADQFVVVKQLTSEFQAERMRDLQTIAQLQDELSDCHLVVAKLQEQERALKSAIRDLEDSLGRERELHRDRVNVDYLKQVVYSYVICTTPTERLPLLSVIATMLHFTPEEVAKAKSLHESKGGGVTGWLTSKVLG